MFFWKIAKIAFKNSFYELFSQDDLRLPKNKIVHKFFITSPNRMNHNFTGNKNIVFEKKNKK